jgi:hypothetical protein
MAGADNDYYLNLTTGDVFKKTNGIWGKVGNIKGPPFTPTGYTGTVKVKNIYLVYVNGILIDVDSGGNVTKDANVIS